MTTLAELLRERMTLAGLNENQLADRLGHSSSGYVHNVITDRQPLSLKAIAAWAKALGLTPGTPEFRTLEEAAKIRKAKAQKAGKPAIEALEKKATVLQSLLVDLVAVMEKKGFQIPRDLREKIELLTKHT
jgi:transcriptional regulator with XRE-family HTH domain